MPEQIAAGPQGCVWQFRLGAIEVLRSLSDHGRALRDELAARQMEAGNWTLNTPAS